MSSIDKDEEEVDTAQIGPTLRKSLKKDLKTVIKKKNDGVYKGELSGFVADALRAQLGYEILAHPTWVDELDEDEKERFKRYVEDFRERRSETPFGESTVATDEDIAELKEEIEAVETMTSRLLSRILTEIGDQEDEQAELKQTSLSDSGGRSPEDILHELTE